MPRIASRLCLCLTLALHSLPAAEQRSTFTKPIRLAYGDPATVAPMMAPSLTYDWDRDGLPDICSSGRWWRNTGQTREGLPIFEPGQGRAVTAIQVGDLDGDAFDDVVAGRKGSANCFRE